MLALSPEKLLVVLVVAVILLGPDKVPQFGRQLGSAWNAFRRTHERVEEEVRNAVPNLPSSQEIARVVRSPAAFLDSLAKMDPPAADRADPPADGHADSQQEVPDPAFAGNDEEWSPPDTAGAGAEAGAEAGAGAGPAGAGVGPVRSSARRASGGSSRVPGDPSMN